MCRKASCMSIADVSRHRKQRRRGIRSRMLYMRSRMLYMRLVGTPCGCLSLSQAPPPSLVSLSVSFSVFSLLSLFSLSLSQAPPRLRPLEELKKNSIKRIKKKLALASASEAPPFQHKPKTTIGQY